MPGIRRPWQLAFAALACGLVGLVILFNPTLEFAAFDAFAHFGSWAHTFMNLALLAELFLLLGGTLGVLILLTRKLFIR